MEKFDITRIPFGYKENHYNNVGSEQGKILTDHSRNTDADISANERINTREASIGNYGSLDNGYKIENLSILPNNEIDFIISPGTVFLRGIRLQMFKPENFIRQHNWLQKPAYSKPDINNNEEYDLIYLEAFEKSVSATEDAELLDSAIGIPDSTRVMTVGKVNIARNIQENSCGKAWNRFINNMAGFSESYSGSLVNHELITDARLKVGFVDIDEVNELCSPDAKNGFLGAENQTICVQIRGKNQNNAKYELIWGINNAAPLYKVKIENENNGSFDIIFETPLHDAYEHPLAGTVVELISPDSILSNGEFVAAHTGILGKVTSSFNNAEKSIQVSFEDFDDYGKIWDTNSDTTEVTRIDPPHYYLRIWRGISRAPDENVIVTFDPAVNETVTLGKTGLTVSVSGTNLYQGLFWIFSARPNTRDQIYPWQITKEAIPPIGVKRYFAPLALLKWEKDANGKISGKIVSDCRKKFRPLTDLKGCCTYFVGDGVDSFGDYDSLEEAIQNLPDTGGNICLLRGIHEANISIINKSDIKISGCGYNSILRPNEKNISNPIIFIENSVRISIQNINLIAASGIAVYLRDNNHTKSFSQEIKVDDNWFFCYKHAIRIETRLSNSIQNRIQISNNEIGMIDRENGDVAIYCRSNSALIERNNIRILTNETRDPNNPRDPEDPNDPTNPCFKPRIWYKDKFDLKARVYKYSKNIKANLKFKRLEYKTNGGIQIGPFSQKIRIIENTISGGKGQGITLGDDLNLNKEVEKPFGPVKLKFQFGRAILDGGQSIVTNLAFRFVGPEGNIYFTQTDSEGFYFLDESNILPGKYFVTSLNEEYSIVQIFVQDQDDVNNFNDIIVKRIPKEKSTIIIEDIDIKSNLISNMGLNGIGSFDMLDTTERLTQVIIENLDIDSNNINNCLSQIPKDILDNLRRNVGFGGISIANVERCRISSNHILNNGVNALFPTCGIFIHKAENLVISYNQINNNGKILRNRTESNAGIYIQFVTPLVGKDKMIRGVNNAIAQRTQSNFACQIHENVVIQPFGLSLILNPAGATSITDNYFETKAINVKNNINQIAGCIFINNFGKSFQKTGVPVKLHNMMNMKVSAATDSYSNKSARLLPNYSGEILFSNNQVHLNNTIELSESIRSSITLASLGDVGFLGNQSLISRRMSTNKKATIHTNISIMADSIRTINNRFQEPDKIVKYSVISKGTLNSTLGNQADHCIVALGLKSTPQNHFKSSNIIVNDQECDNDKKIFILEGVIPEAIKLTVNN